MISISGAINVCADCQSVVREFNNRHKHLQREINELTNEWYKLINRRYHKWRNMNTQLGDDDDANV